MSRAAVESTWVESAAASLAAVEQRSMLPRESRADPIHWMTSDRLVVRSDVDASALPVHIPSEPWTPMTGLPPLVADALQVRGVPGGRLRVRAFYLRHEVTVTVHGTRLSKASALMRGSHVARRLQPPPGLIIPRQLEARRWLRHAWVTEEMLRGKPVLPLDWPGVAPDLARHVCQLWQQSDPRAVPVRHAIPWISAQRVRALLSALGLESERAQTLSERASRIARSELRLVLGRTHGDPTPNNVLLMGHGQLGLVDWEAAGRNLIGLDACRLVATLDDPQPALTILDNAVGALGFDDIHTLAHQAAFALLRLMPTWAGQERLWRAAGMAAAYRRRNRRRLQLLERLLGASA